MKKASSAFPLLQWSVSINQAHGGRRMFRWRATTTGYGPFPTPINKCEEIPGQLAWGVLITDVAGRITFVIEADEP